MWHLCDGTLGTKDLRDLYSVAAGGTLDVDAVGGSADHSHSFTEVGHGHQMPATGVLQSGIDAYAGLTPVLSRGDTDTFDTAPLTHALLPIQYVG